MTLVDPRAGVFEHAALVALRALGVRRRRVTTGAGAVHALDAPGRGPLPPVVLLHGFSSAGVHYAGLIAHLRRHVRRVIAPDAPGHGFSDTPSGLTPETILRAQSDALDRLVDEPFILYGNSMGGLFAIRYALSRPERVRGLVLCSPLGAPMSAAELDLLREPFRVRDQAQALAFVDRVLDAPEPVRQLLAWGVRRKFNHPALRALLDRLSPEDLLAPAEVRALRCPVLLVWGGSERILPPEHRRFFVENLPDDAQVEEPPGFGHGPYLTRPGAVARQILAFARDVERPLLAA